MYRGELSNKPEGKTIPALLLIDWINPFDFDGGDDLKRHALRAVERTVPLLKRCQAEGLPVIFVNDNFNNWSSDKQALCEEALQPSFGGYEVASKLLPFEENYFVLKPRHSGFHNTVLDVLLPYLGVDRLILSGLASNICVLFTANDAHLRGYKMWVPRDCSAAETDEDHGYALRHFQKVLSCSTDPYREGTALESYFS